MQLTNTTRMVAGYTVGLEPSGRELLVVVVKGTFGLPREREPIRLLDEQAPLVMADTFTGEPGFSAPVNEIDFAPRKRFCDVLLTGAAYAPRGLELTRMQCSVRVGPMQKLFEVVGDRVWRAGFTGISASAPKHFVRMPISYDRAFGGSDLSSNDVTEHDAYSANPVGRGWHKHLKPVWLDGKPMPNSEESGEPITRPDGRSRPMALGPLGRGWSQRARYAGTYDAKWLDDDFPFLPRDFDERYYQSAPEDQQLPLPTTAMPVVLSGFDPDGPHVFELPHFDAPVHIFRKGGGRELLSGSLDTIVFEPEQRRFTLTWRATRPLARSIFEIAHVLVGAGSKARLLAIESGKSYVARASAWSLA